MRYRSRWRHLGCVCVLLCLCGCTRVVQVDLINHSGGEITTDLGGTAGAIDAGHWRRIKGPGATPTFAVTWGDPPRTRRYRLRYPRQELGEFRIHSVWHDLLAFQIEPDGSIYAVNPRSAKPVMPLPAQPDGLPLRPDE